jgi:acetyl-CoA carboxylase carboxyltransferase component
LDVLETRIRPASEEFRANRERMTALVAELAERHALARDGATLGPEDEEQIRAPILAKYEHEGSPYYSTARLWDDGILDPAQTRPALALGLSASFNAPIPPPKFGVFRM